MRFKLTLEVNKRAFGNLLPINYQYEQSALIYRLLASANEEYAQWLHENGFVAESGKHFKLFTYSPFKIEKRKVLFERNLIQILSDTVEWQISFMPEKTTEKFIEGLFQNQVFEIGDKRNVVQFWVRNVEVMPAPEYADTMQFETMSPICLKSKSDKGDEYLQPDDGRAKPLVLNALLSKYEAYYGKPFAGNVADFDFQTEGELKRKKILIKANTQFPIYVIGYQCCFTMKAPLELMKIAYESGVGSECSMGFGCVRSACK